MKIGYNPFDKWRTEKLGRPAALSTINTHNSALNRVLDEAELRGWITKAIRPTLLNKGVKQKSRGSFTDEEYEFIVKDCLELTRCTGRPVPLVRPLGLP